MVLASTKYAFPVHPSLNMGPHLQYWSLESDEYLEYMIKDGLRISSTYMVKNYKLYKVKMKWPFHLRVIVAYQRARSINRSFSSYPDGLMLSMIDEYAAHMDMPIQDANAYVVRELINAGALSTTNAVVIKPNSEFEAEISIRGIASNTYALSIGAYDDFHFTRLIHDLASSGRLREALYLIDSTKRKNPIPQNALDKYVRHELIINPKFQNSIYMWWYLRMDQARTPSFVPPECRAMRKRFRDNWTR